MSAPSPQQALRNQGRVAVQDGATPFDFTKAFPHDGIALGLLGDIVARRTQSQFRITAEEFAGEVVDSQSMAETWVLVFAIRGVYPDAVQEVFENTTFTALTNTAKIIYPGSTVQPGIFRAQFAKGVIFTPDDQVNHPAVYFRAAVPEVAVELAIPLGRRPDQDEFVLLAGFLAIRDGTSPDSAVQVGLLENIVL